MFTCLRLSEQASRKFETFTDIEQFEGTCYRASNWKPLRLTKGFERHRADYF
ncbi:Unannotated [Lentimonas sp. CC19]|nr:Unannotated [Lentimonas sp. CC19]CAA6696823.1 Unannotated [Lentimonas sp. CC10]CAA7070760.1 Unannotated [Lentimonas sp. CC11]